MKGLWSWIVGRARCPAPPEEKTLVEDAFRMLEEELGHERLTNATVIEPTTTFFPEPYIPPPKKP
jgi:hypothetical protein